MDQILGLVGGRGIPSLSGGLEISLGSATQLRLWSSTSEPERDEIINKSRLSRRVRAPNKCGSEWRQKLLYAIYWWQSGCLANPGEPELTNYLISCFRQFICAAPRRRQQCVLETVAWAIIPLERNQVGRQPATSAGIGGT